MTPKAMKGEVFVHNVSVSDRNLLKEFRAKLQLIRDRVASVRHGYHTGCYLVGRSGISKTFTVREELDQLDEPSLYRNARMTPWGLFCLLAEHPEHIIVLDDISTLFKNDQAMQVFLAALDGKPRESRLVTYKSKDKDEQFWFSGAIIAISNIPLRCDPLARALGSRVVMLEHEPSDGEISAFMRQLAAQGHQDLTADECLEVAEFVIEETRTNDQRLDLRHLTKAWQDYRQAKHGKSKTSWHDLVRTSLRRQLNESVIPISKKEDIERQKELVKELLERFPNDREQQIAEWPHSKSLFYQRRKEVLASGPKAA